MGWGSLLAAGAAYPIWADYYAMDFFAWAWLLAAIPTVCVISTCFNWAQIALPEIGDLVFHESVRKFVADVKKRVRELIEKRLRDRFDYPSISPALKSDIRCAISFLE